MKVDEVVDKVVAQSSKDQSQEEDDFSNAES